MAKRLSAEEIAEIANVDLNNLNKEDKDSEEETQKETQGEIATNATDSRNDEGETDSRNDEEESSDNGESTEQENGESGENGSKEKPYNFKKELYKALRGNTYFLEQIKISLLAIEQVYSTFTRLEKHYLEDFAAHSMLKKETQAIFEEAKKTFGDLKAQVLKTQSELEQTKTELLEVKKIWESQTSEAKEYFNHLKHKITKLCEETNAKSGEVLLFRQNILEAINRLDEVIKSAEDLKELLKESEAQKEEFKNLNNNAVNNLNALGESLKDDLKNLFNDSNESFRKLEASLRENFEAKLKTNSENAILEFIRRSNEFLERLDKLDNKILSYLPDDTDEQDALNAALSEYEEIKNNLEILLSERENLKNELEDYKSRIQSEKCGRL